MGLSIDGDLTIDVVLKALYNLESSKKNISIAKYLSVSKGLEDSILVG